MGVPWKLIFIAVGIGILCYTLNLNPIQWAFQFGHSIQVIHNTHVTNLPSPAP
jgi:hypothetical protein